MTEVTVDAKWRLATVNFSTPNNAPANIWGQGEVLLTAPAGSLLNAGGKSGPAVNPVVMGQMINRSAEAVASETVEVAGETISMQTIMDALPLFFERWWVEDQNTVPPALQPPPSTMKAQP